MKRTELLVPSKLMKIGNNGIFSVVKKLPAPEQSVLLCEHIGANRVRDAKVLQSVLRQPYFFQSSSHYWKDGNYAYC